MLLSIYSLLLFLSGFQPKQAVPPGTVKFNENTYIDTEIITNFEWMEFLYYVKTDSSAAFYKTMLPDTSQLINGKNNYAKPEYGNVPVAGISETQALAFCKWRSNLVSDGIIHPEKLCIPAQSTYAKFDKNFKVVYRLPTAEELKTVSGKPKKVKPVQHFEEMTGAPNVVVTNAFTKKAQTKTVKEPFAANRTFRCVASFEKR